MNNRKLFNITNNIIENNEKLFYSQICKQFLKIKGISEQHTSDNERKNKKILIQKSIPDRQKVT